MSTLKVSVNKGMVEIETVIPKMGNKSKDLWVLKASQLIWEIWSRMGWQTYGEREISEEDWHKPLDKSAKSRIMASIERLTKLSSDDILEDGESFEMVIKAIAILAQEIEDEDILLKSCYEIEKFRQMVMKLLFIGLLRGLDVQSAVEMDFFADPIDATFCYDREYKPAGGDFLFYETKLSFVGVYSICVSGDLILPTVHIQLPYNA